MIDVLTPGSGFLLGLLASVSSCLAVVGGLVLSLSAKMAEEGRASRTVFALFHAGRLIGFVVLGGVLGAVGGVLRINDATVIGLNILAGIVMLLLGLSLTGILRGKSLKLPRSIFDRLHALESSRVAPLVLGVATFFFPCGFTQAAQIAALASGSFQAGALLMGAFVLGTLPMLLALSFGTAAIAERFSTRYFFKAAGVVVLGFALYSLWSSMAALGYVGPLKLAPASTAVGEIREGVQYVRITAHNGYTPREVQLKAGVPTMLEMHTSETYDCSAGLRIPALGVRDFLPTTGTRAYDLGTHAAGERIEGSCVMGMYGFTLVFE